MADSTAVGLAVYLVLATVLVVGWLSGRLGAYLRKGVSVFEPVRGSQGVVPGHRLNPYNAGQVWPC